MTIHIEITRLWLGAFTPVTMDGKIIVDGILASCYAFYDHEIAHIGITPMRWFPWLIERIFGKDNKSPDFLNVIGDLAKIVLPSSII